MKFKRFTFVFAIAILITTAISCEKDDSTTGNGPSLNDSTSTNGDTSQLSDKEKMLLGKWLYIKAEGNYAGPAGKDTIYWIFESDYTGIYYQNPEYSAPSEQEINWKLDSNDIVFIGDDGSESRNYRVDEWGSDTMRWYNYTLDNIYVVAKQ